MDLSSALRQAAYLKKYEGLSITEIDSMVPYEREAYHTIFLEMKKDESTV